MSSPVFGPCSVDRSGTNRLGGLLDANHDRIIVELNWHVSFQPNDRESTFGFHTAYTRPERNRTVHSTFDRHELYDRSDHQIILNKQQSQLHYQLAVSKTDAYFINALKILGYIPIIGLIPCAVRLIAPKMSEKNSMWLEPQDVREAEFSRGAFEGAGLGFIYIIPDIISTVKRFSK